MRLVIESIPFDSARLPAWLERQLVGERLGELIDELVAIRPPTPFDFDHWFAPLKDQILADGLGSVPRPTLRLLFADPRSLRQLQRAVLLGGGRYWDQVPRKAPARRSRTTAPSKPAPAPLPPLPPPAKPTLLPRVARVARTQAEEVVPLTVAPVTSPPARSRPRTPPPRPGGVPVWVVVLIALLTVALIAGGAVAAWLLWQASATPPTG